VRGDERDHGPGRQDRGGEQGGGAAADWIRAFLPNLLTQRQWSDSGLLAEGTELEIVRRASVLFGKARPHPREFTQ
jgi:hypothetical protein